MTFKNYMSLFWDKRPHIASFLFNADGRYRIPPALPSVKFYLQSLLGLVRFRSAMAKNKKSKLPLDATEKELLHYNTVLLEEIRSQLQAFLERNRIVKKSNSTTKTSVF